MRRLPAALLACGIAVVAVADAAQPDALESDPWQPVRFLLGRWTGTVQGESGNGTAARRYEFTLANRFFAERDVSTYPAQARNRMAEAREHRGFISHDRLRNKLVLRQFDQDGNVHTY